MVGGVDGPEFPQRIPSDQGLNLIQIGCKPFRSQPPHIWISGRILLPSGPKPNNDLPRVIALLANARTSLQQQYANTRINDLATYKLKLSYIDPIRCLQILQSMGYTIAQPGKPIDPKSLPAIMALPPTAAHKLVGGSADKPEPKNTDFPLTETDPITDLLVFYHPAKPEQLSLLLDKVNRVIDRPARQILIEAKYYRYIEKQRQQIGRMEQMHRVKIPADFDYRKVQGLSNEIVEKLERATPPTLFEASRISGITPAAVEILHVYIKMGEKGKA